MVQACIQGKIYTKAVKPSANSDNTEEKDKYKQLVEILLQLGPKDWSRFINEIIPLLIKEVIPPSKPAPNIKVVKRKTVHANKKWQKKWKKAQTKPNLIYLNKLKIDNQPKREKNEIAAWNKFDGLRIENKDKKKIKTNKQRFPQNKKALKEKPSQKLPVKIDHKFN